VGICRCKLGQLPFAGAVLVGRWPLSSVLRWWQPEEVVSADETVGSNHHCCCLAARGGGRCRCRWSGRRRATWSLLSRRPSGVEVVHTHGSGTGVPFVMVP
jgi:hypothetical protein